jgi:PGDYG protein
MHITAETASTLLFKTYQKKAFVQAYCSTEEDHAERGGVIETLEGSVSFAPGDYICTGLQCEKWPVSAQTFQETYAPVRRDGNSMLYRSKARREAVKIDEDFTVRRSETELYHGKPGDYLVRQGDKLWIVDAGVFEASYELAAEQ